ncbi:UNVERIFIED_CONTAM: hypothetical protein FKN15_047648 [Acipenser sinensis]
MAPKKKKNKQDEEIEEDDVEERQSKPKSKSKAIANGGTREGKKKSRNTEESETTENVKPKTKKKGEANGKIKQKKKSEEDHEEDDEVIVNDDKSRKEKNNNDTKTKDKKKAKELSEDEGVKEEVSKKKKKKSTSTEKEDMGLKDKRSKEGRKKHKKKPSEEEEEVPEAEEEEDPKKKKKGKKSKKGSAGSDEEKTDKKKGKGKKSKKQVDYSEIYEQELKNYNTDSSDGCEDEYHKRKVYEVVTITGDVRGAGTDANIFVTLFGEYGITPKVHLASKSRTAFEKNKTDVFRIKTNNVGQIKKIRIEHDNTGMNASWFLDRAVVTDMNRPHLRYYFPCNNWLSREEGDGLYVRDLLGSLNPMDVPKLNKYIVSVFTPDIKGSGTDADVFLNIFGENGDTGERRLDNDKNNFERGSEDKFTIEAPNLGRLRKITIGHNNKGSSAGWFLDKVIVDDMGNKAVYEFPVNRWFAMDEDDGKIQRDILVGGSQATGIVYNISVVTGKVRGAGTNSKVHILMHGSKGIKNSGKIFLEGGQFERGLTDIFNVEIAALLSPLFTYVIVYCPFTGIEQTFPCDKWLDEDEGDGLIERELYEMVSLRQKKQKKLPWSLWIWTSDIKNAGSDANVFLQIYGEKGKSDEMRLDNNSDNFETGQTDKFMVTLLKTLSKEKYTFNCGRWLDMNEDDNEIIRELPAEGLLVKKPLPIVKYRITIYTGTKSGSGTDASVFICLYGDMGDTGERVLYASKNNVNKFESGNADEFLIEAVSLKQVRRVRIGHNGRGGGCGWFLDKVVVREEGQPETQAVEFPCNRQVLLYTYSEFQWLDRNEDDGQIVRELVPAGEAPMLRNISYHIAVKTGNIPGASSDSKVFVKLYGEKGDTNKQLLVVSDNDLRNYFETGHTDIFTIDTIDIGKINRLLIGHNNEGLRAGWFLDSVQIKVPVHGKQYMFPSHRWLCKDEADGKVEVEIYPSEILDIEKLDNYEITVHTGNVRAAGTNASVFIQIYGEKGKTELISLQNRSNNFERGSTEVFKVEAAGVGKLFKIRIGHNGKGAMDGWYLESVIIKHLTTSIVPQEDKKKKKKKKKAAEEEGEGGQPEELVETYTFLCQRWLARDEGDGELVVELLPEDSEDLEENTYEVHVFTGSVLGAGTDANVYINVYGEMGDTGERHLKKSNNLNKFEKGQEDIFTIPATDLGLLKKLRIRHDNSQAQAAWFLDRVEIIDGKDDTTYYFPCERWLATDEDDGQIARELVPVDEAFMKKNSDSDEQSQATLGLEQKAQSTTYTVTVKTGDKKYAGTDANVFITLYGDKDDTGIVNLKASKTYKNKFERGQIDEFTVEAVDIGMLKKIRIGHDCLGNSSGWFLDWVEIDAPSLGQKLRFPCGRWLDKAEDDGATERDLFPANLQTQEYNPFVPYEITTYTSDIYGAGTDADVFIVLYGRDSVCTQQKSLCVNKRERRMYFERGAADKFIVELEDVGDVIEKIRIGHDGKGINSGWHLDRVEVRRLLPKGKGSETAIFPCERWLAKSEDDGEIVRELVPSEIIQEKLLRDGTLKRTESIVEDALETHTYTVSVYTGDVYSAGTDANVFLTIYGDLGDTGERKLSKSETNYNKFERGQVDKFTIEAVDLGQIYKLNIRHDNTMMSADWYLDQVEIMDMDTEETYLFQCERWLSKNKEDKKIERVLYVKGYDGERISLNSSKKSLKDSSLSLKTLDSNMNKKNKRKSILDEVIEEGATISYHITISTGSERDSGTTSRAYILIMGSHQVQTARLWLDLPEDKTGFAPGSMEKFQVEGADVGEIKKIELGHDGATPESCWLVDELAVAVPTKGVMYIFHCKCWLAKDRGDGLTARIFSILDADNINIGQKVLYELTVVTGDTQNAGTDANIYMSVFGANGTTEEILLCKNGNRFERGQEDTFAMEIDDVAPLRKIRIRTDGKGSRPDWFLNKIVMQNMSTQEVSVFTYNEWLSKTRGPKRTTMCELAAVIDDEEMVEKTTYTIMVKTSDISGSGTDANVYIIVFGENGDTGTIPLKECNNTNKFERKQMDVFKFPEMLSLGELSKVRVWHDNKGVSAGWHLEFIEVKDETMDKTFRFHCDRWLAKNEDDGQIIRELPCANNDVLDFTDRTKYEILTVTSDRDDADTKENVWIVLEGNKGRSKEFLLENSTKKKKFLRGATDKFDFSSKNVGDIANICLGHCPKEGKKFTSKNDAYWHVEEIIVTERELGNKGATDKFDFSSKNVGDIANICLGHCPKEGKKFTLKNDAYWHVEEIIVTERELGNKYIFRCKAKIPLSPKRDDFMSFECAKAVESFASKARSLVPVKYEIIIITGGEKGAGTDANVFITIYGSNGDSGKRALQQKFRNLFERGRTDRFIVEMLDLGEIHKVKVEHDNSSMSPGWLLDRVEITNTATGVTTLFLCGKWLDKKRGDGQTWRVLYPK